MKVPSGTPGIYQQIEAQPGQRAPNEGARPERLGHGQGQPLVPLTDLAFQEIAKRKLRADSDIGETPERLPGFANRVSLGAWTLKVLSIDFAKRDERPPIGQAISRPKKQPDNRPLRVEPVPILGPRATLPAVQGHIRRAYTFVCSFLGADPRAGLKSVRNLPHFVRTLAQYRAAASGSPFPLNAADIYPALQDFDANAGEASGHYFFQDLWAARKIFERRPERHIDIGSRIDGFVAHLLTFMPVTVIDVRPLTSSVVGLDFVHADATSLDGFSDRSVDSVSSLHAVEHFGLGRYGDPVDPDGWRKALLALQRVLRPGGRLYLSVPVGRERLCFNAHRIFSPMRVLDTVADLDLVSFAGVDDSGRFLDAVKPEELAHQEYACGLFELTR